jgi:hypothetical protein
VYFRLRQISDGGAPPAHSSVNERFKRRSSRFVDWFFY